MAYDSTTSVTDGVNDNLASYHNELKVAADHVMSASPYGAYVRTQSMTANVTLTDADFPVQSFSPTAARDLTFPAIASTNHSFYVINRGAYDITCKNSGATVIGIVPAYCAAFFVSDGANGWYDAGVSAFETAYKITPTVASNNLTLTVTHADGTTPAVTRPLWFYINGQYRPAVAALTFTLNAGTAWMNLSAAELQTKEVDLFAYASWRAASSQVIILASRVTWARLYSQFSGTSTNETYAGFNASPGAPASGDAVEVIGRFAATLSATNNWSVPTYDNDNLVHGNIRNTRRLTWTPTHSRVTTNYTNLPTVTRADYLIDDRRLLFYEAHAQNATPGGSGFQRLTMPFSNPMAVTQPVYGINNTAGTAFGGYWLSSSANMNIIKYDASAEATASNTYIVEGALILAL